ncbi:hypothetical protein [Luteolibacter marinus]|uniref:hypothetical protein n=1 Tax=Luteolibacter marinus TaxID=2776705 RepID=UPI0018668796|nr:hypothetical protein [Luteolibacter marinus]
MKASLMALMLAAFVLPLHAAEGDGAKKKPNPEKIFKKKDADKDGFLSKEEFTKGAKNAERAGKAFAKKDKDSDGKLSPAEFKAAPQKKKKP